MTPQFSHLGLTIKVKYNSKLGVYLGHVADIPGLILLGTSEEDMRAVLDDIKTHISDTI